MPYIILKAGKNLAPKVEEVLKDDLVSRQSIVVRDGDALGLDKETRFVLVEGSAEGVLRAETLLSSAGCTAIKEDAEGLYRRFKEQEEDAASGIGLIFG
ncbi:MAG: hypothetical protein AB1665_06665 [Candidatus Thermoplasmatota archaeon]